MRRGKCHHFWASQKAHPCAAASSTLAASHKPGPGMLVRCTYHPSDIAHLMVLSSSRATRQIPLFAATWVNSLCNSGGLQPAPQYHRSCLANPPTFHHEPEVQHLSPRSEGLRELPLPLPAWEGGSCLACVSRNTRWLCVCWGSLPELPPDGAIARLHC